MPMLSGTTIFMLIVMGAVVGWTLSHWIEHEGISLGANITWGIIGALIGGILAKSIGLLDVLIFGLLTSLTMLYLANVFHLHHVEDIEGDEKKGMRIQRKYRR